MTTLELNQDSAKRLDSQNAHSKNNRQNKVALNHLNISKEEMENFLSNQSGTGDYLLNTDIIYNYKNQKSNNQNVQGIYESQEQDQEQETMQYVSKKVKKTLNQNLMLDEDINHVIDTSHKNQIISKDSQIAKNRRKYQSQRNDKVQARTQNHSRESMTVRNLEAENLINNQPQSPAGKNVNISNLQIYDDSNNLLADNKHQLDYNNSKNQMSSYDNRANQFISINSNQKYNLVRINQHDQKLKQQQNVIEIQGDIEDWLVKDIKYSKTNRNSKAQEYHKQQQQDFLSKITQVTSSLSNKSTQRPQSGVSQQSWKKYIPFKNQFQQLFGKDTHSKKNSRKQSVLDIEGSPIRDPLEDTLKKNMSSIDKLNGSINEYEVNILPNEISKNINEKRNSKSKNNSSQAVHQNVINPDDINFSRKQLLNNDKFANAKHQQNQSMTSNLEDFNASQINSSRPTLPKM
eukprot:403359849